MIRFLPWRLASYIAASARANRLSRLPSPSVEAGQALAHRNAERLAVVVETQALDLSLQPFGHLHCHVWRAAGEHGGKLFPTNAPEQIPASQRTATALGDPLQHIVTLGMAVAVVDHFEVIDIQQQECQWRTLQARLFEFAIGAFEEVAPIAALGQHVGSGQALQLGFHLLFIGDVLGDTDNHHRLSGFVLTIDEAFIADPAYLAVGGNDPVFAIFHGAFVQDVGEAAFGVVQIVGVDAVAPLVVVREQQSGGAAEIRS